MPCSLGTRLGEVRDEYAAALAGYALNLGLAFQLADDALDLVGDTQLLGKATLTDIREGVYSYPLIYVLSQGGADGVRLRALLRQARLNESELRAVVRRSFGIGELWTKHSIEPASMPLAPMNA